MGHTQYVIRSIFQLNFGFEASCLRVIIFKVNSTRCSITNNRVMSTMHIVHKFYASVLLHIGKKYNEYLSAWEKILPVSTFLSWDHIQRQENSLVRVRNCVKSSSYISYTSLKMVEPLLVEKYEFPQQAQQSHSNDTGTVKDLYYASRCLLLQRNASWTTGFIITLYPMM